MDVVSVIRPFLKLWLPPHRLFGMGEARQFKFSVQTDINKYFYMHDRLPANEYVRVT